MKTVTMTRRRRCRKSNWWMMFASIATLLFSLVVLVSGTDESADNTGSYPANQQVCDARFVPSSVDTSSSIYTQGGEVSAQAYKRNAPVKNIVCDRILLGDDVRHKVAHWSFWRKEYKDLVPISLRGNIYACNGNAAAARKNNEVTMEVWQPRPDGTYSSIRPGVEEGDCRASVPIILATATNNNETANNIDTDNKIGTVEFETFAPGSIGILNGLVPSSSRECPPYKPGVIHLFINIAGYQPLLTQLSMSELNDWMAKKNSKGRFKLANAKTRSNGGATEILSVTPTSKTGYKLAIEVEVNFFLVENDRETNETLEEILCSDSRHRGRWSWVQSFFKEPISICSAAYLDFFAL